MSVSSIGQSGATLPPWDRNGATPASSGSGFSASSTTPSQPAGSANLLQTLTQDVQSFLLRMQSASATAGGAGGARPADGDGDSDGTSGAAGSQGRRHHHYIDTQDAGGARLAGADATGSAGASAGANSAGSSLVSSGATVLNALGAYSSPSQQNQQSQQGVLSQLA